MRRIVATEYLTLDGVMEAPNLWSFDFWSEQAAAFKFDELKASDALLLGRVTYEGFAAAWPKMEGTGEFGERMNGLPKFVVSKTLKEANWNNSTIIGDGVVEALTKLKQESGQDILLSGSADLVNSLMPYNLIDEYRIMLYPVVYGTGKHLFHADSKKKLKLVDTEHFDSGVMILHYEPAKEK
jgi:dihydrofolate reductase